MDGERRAEVDALFREARRFGFQKREAFLDEKCAGDPSLRSEVNDLLVAYEEAAKIPSTGGADVGSKTLPVGEAMPPPDPARPPERIGAYKILQVLGEGGMGIVYLAEQSEPIRRRVALKVIKLGMDTKEVIARFEAERQALALMSHPNIAKVLDAGVSSDGRPYFVMEHVPGEPITEYCDRHRLTNGERLGLFVQVCEAVQHAHQKAIIHRDLKPSNVLVMVQDGKALPKIIDFGVAKATNQRLTEKTLFTELGQIIGTPEYMSPEQAEMTSLDIDTRTDIYSLGVLLYELITGELPFSSEELRRGGYAEIQRKIREEEPPKPSTRLSALGEPSRAAAENRHTDLVRLLRELRGDLDWIAMKAMEKDRTRRYSTAAELAGDVGRHLREEPVAARPPEVVYRLRKFIRKNRGPVAAAAVVILALVAGLAAATGMYFRAERQRSEKEAALVEKEGALREKTAAFEVKDAALEEKTRALADRESALRRSEGLRLAGHSKAALPENPGLALLLAIEGAKRAPGAEANEALLAALQNNREVRTLGRRNGRDGFRVNPPSFSPDGRRVVTGVNETARIWDVETGKELVVLEGHTSVVEAACFSPDGRHVLTGSYDKTARIWDSGTGKEILKFQGHEEAIDVVTFSPDGRHAVTGREAMKIWDAETGKEVLKLEGHEDRITSASFSPDGRRLLTGSWDKTARIWDAETGKEQVVLRGHDGQVYSASFSPDGRQAVTGSGDATVRIWDAETGKEILAHRDANCAGFSPDGRRMVTGSSFLEHVARIWDFESWKEIVVLRGHEDAVSMARFSPDGRRVMTWSLNDGTARIWEVEGWKDQVVLRAEDRMFQAASFSPDGRRVVTASWTTASIRDAGTGQEILDLQGHEETVTSAIFSPDGRRLLTGSWDKTARIWDAGTGKEVAVLRGHDGIVYSPSFDPSGRRVVTGSADKTARIWDAESGREIAVLRGHEAEVLAGFSPDGRRVVTDSPDKTARVWDAESGKELLVFKGHGGFGIAPSASISPDGRLAVTDGEGPARIVDAGTGKEIRILQGVLASFSPDGRRVMAISGSAAKIWDVESGKELVVLQARESLQCARLSSDGRRVLALLTDRHLTWNAVTIWDSESGEEILTLRNSGSEFRSASFSPDGRSVLTVSNGAVTIWPLDLLDIAERRKPRDLTQEEVERYRVGSLEKPR